MAITNKLITFNKLTSFETQLAQGNILETSIVFIKDAKKIWTKGTYFDCSGGSSNIAVYETTDDVYNGVLNNTTELTNLLINNSIYTLIIIQKNSSNPNRNVFVFNVCSAPIFGFRSYNCIFTNADFKGVIKNPICYQIEVNLDVHTYELIKQDLALKSDIGYTTEFSVADIEAVYGRGITKPINVQGLISAIEANIPIIIPTNITDASNVGGNAVTMARMENDGFIYLNVIVPYLDGVHKEYFIQIKITTAQLIKSGSNGSITLKELVAKTDLKTINGESILGSGDIAISGGGGTSDGKTEVEYISGDMITTIDEMRPNVVYWIDGADIVMIDSFKEPVSGVETYDVFTAVMVLGSIPGASVSLTLPNNVTWANGEIPTLEENDYELSISRISDGYGFIKYYAVLTPFKSV